MLLPSFDWIAWSCCIDHLIQIGWGLLGPPVREMSIYGTSFGGYNIRFLPESM